MTTVETCPRESCCRGLVAADEWHTRAEGVMAYLLAHAAGREVPAQKLAEFRCPTRGHLLGTIYQTYAGPLFAPSPYRPNGSRSRELHRALEQRPDGWHGLPSFRYMDSQPVLLDELEQAQLAPLTRQLLRVGLVDCRCGRSAGLVPLDDMRAAVARAEAAEVLPVAVVWLAPK